MSINATAGSKIYIGTTLVPATDDATGYAVDTYVEVAEVQSIGDFGDKAEEIKFTAVGDSRTRKMKGARDAGDIQLEVGRDPFDPGQIALRAAAASNSGYNFKIVLNDKSISTDTATTFYFKALVNGASNQLKGVNDVTVQTFELAITSDIVETAAAHVVV
jgi:Phage tail tube protein, TTP